ncbi:MAG: phosphatase PAP2 family protein [Lacunisphaera sp.]|nr:phosphatase PAP2 family protein [Lacunisphaera sp.]
MNRSSAPPSSPPDWLQAAGIRLLAWWPAKLIGISLGMSVFFAVYFWVLRHPLYPVTIMPLTAIDRWIGFQPAALPLYLSLWLYVVLAPSLLTSRRELVACGLAWTALSAIGLGIFLRWPTIVPRPAIDWSLHPSLAFLKSVDASGNACPSLHVAFAVFTAFALGRILRKLGAGPGMRAGNWLWCLVILYSTVATLQHVFLDVVAGAALGTLIALGFLPWLRGESDNSAGLREINRI